MKEKIYELVPRWVQCLMISLYNRRAYRFRYGGKYRACREYFRATDGIPLARLREIQETETRDLINYAVRHSAFYREKFRGLDTSRLENLPVIAKEEFRKNLDSIHTVDAAHSRTARTGGTTGASMTVRYTPGNTQKRFAILDDFRSGFGYELGKRTAWFSGKNLLTVRDIGKKRFWKTDVFHRVRYYSSYHIRLQNLKYYVENLIKYRPEFMVGFPSCMAEIARFGTAHGIEFPADTIRAIFPTAESITPDVRRVIETFFKAKMYDQYASSEGAPFIFECREGNLHADLRSGVFEVLDGDRLVVTSFTTYGTPLIRYDIGDRVEMGSGECPCGNHNPLVRSILGRIDDYVFSPLTGKINLGNVSNTTKEVNGIVKFQAVQNSLTKLDLHVVIDDKVYTGQDEARFLRNWRDRVGGEMELILIYEKDIPVEKSGKYRIVKNNMKHLIEQNDKA